MPRHHRTYLDLLTDWAGEPLLRMTAIETGMHTHRGIRVAPLCVTIVELTDAYEARRVSAYRTPTEALTAARELMTLPDSRGFERAWVEDDGLPGTEPIVYGPSRDRDS